MTLLRVLGPTGQLIGYELRDDFAGRARNNVTSFLGPDAPFAVEVRDVYEGIDEQDLDRVVLDLPEPWQVVPHAEKALRPGGILVSYLPTIGQVAQLREDLARSRLRHGRDDRGAPAELARRGPVRAARPPDGRPHRVPDQRPLLEPGQAAATGDAGVVPR